MRAILLMILCVCGGFAAQAQFFMPEEPVRQPDKAEAYFQSYHPGAKDVMWLGRQRGFIVCFKESDRKGSIKDPDAEVFFDTAGHAVYTTYYFKDKKRVMETVGQDTLQKMQAYFNKELPGYKIEKLGFTECDECFVEPKEERVYTKVWSVGAGGTRYFFSRDGVFLKKEADYHKRY